MESLPPHPEVAGALEARGYPLRLVALVNPLQVVGEAQLNHVGIRVFRTGDFDGRAACP
jgi:hypothetical protein